MQNTLGVVMVDLIGITLGKTEKDLLSHPSVGGVILFSRNFESKKQIKQLCDEIHQIRTPKLLIAVDQEGGRVQRFKNGFAKIPAMRKLGYLYDKDKLLAIQSATNIGWLMAHELREVGVDFSFAPILDIDTGLSKVIGNRAFHHNATGVVDLASAWINGMHQAGMAATGKHFPGHGSVTADSHIDTPVDNRELSEIKQQDLIPFKIQTLDAIMPAHVYYSKLDADNPAGFSKFWLQTILKEQLKFSGTIFSDDLSMQAAAKSGSFTKRAKSALDAGCDMVLVCNNPNEAWSVADSLIKYDNKNHQEQLLKMQGKDSKIDLTKMALKSLQIL